MQRVSGHRVIPILVFTILSAWAGATSHAIIWNGTDHPERGVTSANGLTDQPGYFSNVRVINNNFNSTRGTATYLANGWIITARHVVQGSSYSVIGPPEQMNFQSGGSNFGALTIPMPFSAEICLVRLQTTPSGMTELPSDVIYTGFSETDKIVQMGGFGYWGWIEGSTSTSASFHRGYNISWINGSMVSTQTDGEQRLEDLGLLETGAMPGDSGSPLFLLDAPDTSVNDWSQYKLGGILATSQGNFWGADSNYVRMGGFSQYITDIVWGSGNSYTWARGTAGTFSWNNSTLNGDMTNGNNWNSSLSPTHPVAAGDAVDVGNGLGANNQTINLDQDITVGQLAIGNTNGGSGTQTVAPGGAFKLTFDNFSAPGMIFHNPVGREDVISAPIVIAGNGTLMVSNPSSSTLTLSGGVESGLSSGTQTIQHTMGAVEISGSISDGSAGGSTAISVTRDTLILSGNNSHSGGTTVSQGLLRATADNALGTGTVNMAAGTTLEIVTSPSSGPINVNSPITGAGDVHLSGPDAVVFTGNNTHTGDTIIHNGTTLALTGSATLTNTPLIDVRPGATLDVSGLSGALTLGNGQTLNHDSNTVLAGSLNAQSGSTIRVGGLELPVDLSQFVIDDFESYDTGLVRDVADPPWTAHGGGAGTQFAVIEDDGGNQVLSYGWSGGNRGTSRDMPEEGQIEDGDIATFFFRFNSKTDDPDHNFGLAADVDTSADADFSDFEAQFRIVQGTTGGTVAVNARDGGGFTANLAANLSLNTWYNVWMVVDQTTDTYDVYLNDGPGDATGGDKLNGSPLGFRNGSTSAALDKILGLAGTGGVDNGVRFDYLSYLEGADLTNPLGGLSPSFSGDSETLFVDGDVTMGPGATLEVDIFTPTIHDILDVTGTFIADGILDVSLHTGAPAPQFGDVFDILAFGSVSGAFDTLNLPSLGAGLNWDSSSLLTTGILHVVTVPGDADGDGDVDLDDYNIMSGNMYEPMAGGAADGDFDGSGFVDFEDFVIQSLNFGDWPSAEEMLGDLAPEPTSAALLVLTATLLTRAGRRRG